MYSKLDLKQLDFRNWNLAQSQLPIVEWNLTHHRLEPCPLLVGTSPNTDCPLQFETSSITDWNLAQRQSPIADWNIAPCQSQVRTSPNTDYQMLYGAFAQNAGHSSPVPRNTGECTHGGWVLLYYCNTQALLEVLKMKVPAVSAASADLSDPEVKRLGVSRSYEIVSIVFKYVTQ